MQDGHVNLHKAKQAQLQIKMTIVMTIAVSLLIAIQMRTT